VSAVWIIGGKSDAVIISTAETNTNTPLRICNGDGNVMLGCNATLLTSNVQELLTREMIYHAKDSECK
jgi:hypothetical protein